LGKDMVPKRIFFTKGVGRHRERLTSFELALRDAGIAAQNLVRVSSIFPPNCKLLARKEGVKYLHPGEVVFAVVAENTTREPHRLLAHRVAFDLDIGAVPVVVENLALRVHQALPAAVAGAVQRRGGLVAKRGTGTLARPAVCQVFHDAQLLARPQPADHGRAREVVACVVGDLNAAIYLDLVVHRGGHHQRAGARPVHQQCAALGVLVVDGLQRRLEDGRDPRIARRNGLVFVGDQFGNENTTGAFAGAFVLAIISLVVLGLLSISSSRKGAQR